MVGLWFNASINNPNQKPKKHISQLVFDQEFEIKYLHLFFVFSSYFFPIFLSFITITFFKLKEAN